MPRNFFKKYQPRREQLTGSSLLGLLGQGLHQPALWHVSRRPISRAMAIGIAIALLPLPGQMLLAGLLAMYFRATLPIAVGLVWLTNPLTALPIYYFNYLIGSLVLHSPPIKADFDRGSQWLWETLHEIWLPLCLGSVLCAALLATLVYFITSWIWQLYVHKARLLNQSKIRWPHKKKLKSPGCHPGPPL